MDLLFDQVSLNHGQVASLGEPLLLDAADHSASRRLRAESSFKSQLKHIDARQEWVRILRDKEICIPTPVDTKDNLADIFTKILPEAVFTSLRDRLMYDPNRSV